MFFTFNSFTGELFKGFKVKNWTNYQKRTRLRYSLASVQLCINLTPQVTYGRVFNGCLKKINYKLHVINSRVNQGEHLIKIENSLAILLNPPLTLNFAKILFPETNKGKQYSTFKNCIVSLTEGTGIIVISQNGNGIITSHLIAWTEDKPLIAQTSSILRPNNTSSSKTTNVSAWRFDNQKGLLPGLLFEDNDRINLNGYSWREGPLQLLGKGYQNDRTIFSGKLSHFLYYNPVLTNDTNVNPECGLLAIPKKAIVELSGLQNLENSDLKTIQTRPLSEDLALFLIKEDGQIGLRHGNEKVTYFTFSNGKLLERKD